MEPNIEIPVGERKNGKGGSEITGVVKLRGQTQLPQEFITAAKSFPDALAKTTFISHSQKNSIILLWGQLDMFDVINTEYPKGTMHEEKQALVNLLTGNNAVGGFNKSLAAMTHTGIYLPEGAGIKLSKEDRKALTQLQAMKMQQKNQGQDGGEQSQQ